MINDLTQGIIWKKISLFAIPFLLSSLFQHLYNTVDLLYAGNMLGKSVFSAIGISSLLITCLVGFFGGLSVGSSVVVSHMYGSRDPAKIKSAIQNAVAISFLGGILLMVMGTILAPYYLKFINTPETFLSMAVGYLRIYFLSFVSILAYNIGSGVLRALGDSRTPLYAQIIGGVMNVLMDALFIIIFDAGIYGLAWATLISQTVAAVLILYRLTILDGGYALCFRKIGFDRKILKKIIGIGFPAGAQSLVITLSNVIAQYQINSLGEDAIAAFTAYFKVELIIYLPIVALGQTIMIFVGQNIGAHNFKRVKLGVKQCLMMGMILTATLSAFAIFSGPLLFRAFAKENAVIDLGLRIIRVTFPFYIMYVILQVLGDSIRGIGNSRPPMVIVMINICIIRTFLLFLIVPRLPNVRGVAMTYPITWALTAASMAIYCLYQQRFNRKDPLYQI
jgi:putative MATE family efflux protein